MVGPKSTTDFTVTFKTDSDGIKEALFIAYPKISDNTQGNVKFDDLAVKVIAGGLAPHLTVDKMTNLEGEYDYNFCVHSYGKHPKPYRPIILINKEKINMIVKLDIEGPFKIIKTDPIEASLGNGIYNIIPNSNLKVDIKFIIPNVSNEKEWPMTLTNIKRGKLNVTFENGEKEHYNLIAYLLRPRILMSLTGNQSVESLDYIDFGYVNCTSTKIQPIYLMNDTQVDTNWQINYVKFIQRKNYGVGTITIEEKEDMDMCDDNTVFNFEISSGVIYGPTEILFDLPVGPALPRVETIKTEKYKPLLIKVAFHPKKNIFYKCRYKITTSTGNEIDFILKGHGSYLEEHIVDPKVQVKWGQYDAEGSYCPNGVAGCGNIAVAQIMTYFKYPSSIQLTYPNSNNETLTLNWTDMCQHKISIYYDTCSGTTHNMIGKLVRQIGYLSNSTYYTNPAQTSTGTANSRSVMSDLGYSVSNVYGYSEGMFDNILISGGLVFMRGEKYNGDGHAWIIDGCDYQTIRHVEFAGLEVIYDVTTSYNYNHINWGWNGYGNGYFTDGVFNAATPHSSDGYYHPTGNANNYYDDLQYFSVYHN